MNLEKTAGFVSGLSSELDGESPGLLCMKELQNKLHKEEKRKVYCSHYLLLLTGE